MASQPQNRRNVDYRFCSYGEHTIKRFLHFLGSFMNISYLCLSIPLGGNIIYHYIL